MKKIVFICLLALSFLSPACKKVLDSEKLDLRTEVDVWSDPKLAQAYLNRIWYATIRNDYAYESWFGLYAGPLNANEFVSDNTFNRGNRGTPGIKNESSVKDVTANVGAYDSFTDITRVNIAIDHLSDPATAALFGTNVTNDMLGQAYFGKGLIYFAKAANFGGYPIIEKTLSPIDDFKLKRASIKATYDYSISLLEKAAMLLNKAKISGRPNKAAAYALLSEVALHGAAYIKYGMLNGDPATDLNVYYNKSIDAVAKLDAEGLYTLEPQATFGKMFNDFSYASGKPNEIILAQFTPPGLVKLSDDKKVELLCYVPVFTADLLTDATKAKYANAPYSGFQIAQAFSTIAPNPKAVDEAFYIVDLDGKSRRWAESQTFAKYIAVSSGTYSLNAQAAIDGITDIAALMYKNRDKRFYATIAYDGGTYFNNRFDSRIGGNMHPKSFKTLNTSQGAITGYVFRKTIPETQTWGMSDISGWYRVGLRLSRAYLNAAESNFMLGDFAKCRDFINYTRTTHGGLPALTNETGEALWKIYMDERNAELMLENDRYYTLLRSGIRNGAEGIPELNFGEIKQFEVAADGKSYKYVTPLFNAVDNSYSFGRHRYLFPVPKTVTDANPNYLPNNPRY